ncbi:hypothetical protein CJU89_2000 [Yarrowia sp. B02]|nr:hypothetical protein CJU89_2000 [Yarrowia sp. B02]
MSSSEVTVVVPASSTVVVPASPASSPVSTVLVTATPEAGTTITIHETQLPPAKTVTTVTTTGWAPPSWSTTFVLPPTPIVTLEQSPAPTTDVYLVYPTPNAYNVFPCQSDHTYYIPDYLENNNNHFAICSKGQVWTSAGLCGSDTATMLNGTTVSVSAPLPNFEFYTTKPVFYLNVPPVQCYRGGAWVLAYDTIVASAQTQATKYVDANAAPGGVANVVPTAAAAGALLALLF